MATAQEVQTEYDAVKTAVASEPATMAALDALELGLVTLADQLRAGDPKPTGGEITSSIPLSRGADNCLRAINAKLAAN